MPPMRPLFLDFPDDPVSWEVEDQFLFGADILVAPVVVEGARQRRVPAGRTAWRDAWTAADHAGGQWITAPAPVDTIPVFLREGSRAEHFGSLAEPGR